MKKISVKILTAFLATVLALGCTMPAFACSDKQSVSSFIADVQETMARVISIFKGSTNEKSDLEFESETEKIFKTFRHFSSSHASTIVKAEDGSLVSAWFAGSSEGNKDIRIWYSYKQPGQPWSEPAQVASEDKVAHWNPVLQSFDGFIRLYYKVGMEIPYWVTKYVDSYDGGKTWSEAKTLVEDDTSGGRGPVRNKCFVTSSGTIIAPASTEQGPWKAFFDISVDGGNTWTKTDYIVAKDEKGEIVEMIQPTIWQDGEGNLHAMFRTKGGYIYRADSSDGGFTWNEAYSTGIFHNNSGIDCVMTDDGKLFMVYNPIGVNGRRNKLILSVSEDNGSTWKDVMYLEDSPIIFTEFSYPAIIADGNTLHITYTYNRNNIKYTCLTYN